MSDLAPEPIEQEPSLRDEIGLAFEADAGAAGLAPLESAAPVVAGETPEQTQQRARDEAGRFTKPQEQAKTALEAKPQAAAGPVEGQTISPPASWSAAAKADFKALAPHIQQEVLKRERDIEQGKAQWDQKGERLNRLDAVLGPRRERFQLAGLDEVQAITALLAAQDILDKDPYGGIATLAQRYGVDLRRLVQGVPQGQAAPQAQPMAPEYQQLASQVQTLQNELARRSQDEARQTAQQYVSEVDAFRSDPKNQYFENVKDDMVALLQSNRAAGLQDAYEKALWANPETRSIVARAQQEEQAAAARAAATARAQQARYAGGSINGSPQPGSSPANAGPASSIRDELARAFSEVS
jgi:hypothetical protein